MDETLRFLIKSAHAGIVEVAWSKERDHHPVAVGTVQLHAGIPAEDAVGSEAQAYVAQWECMNGENLWARP